MVQLVRFLLVGGLATALQFALTATFVAWAGTDPVLASAIGFAVSAMVNYQLNRVITFASKVPHRVALARFCLVAGAGLAINAMVMWILVALSGLHYLIAQIGATSAVLVWNYSLGKRWTYANIAS